jgi:hypothetical protein
MQLYATSHPEWKAPSAIEAASGHRWLGGNVMLLRRVLMARSGSGRAEAGTLAR